MRILQINSFCGVASTGRIARDIHRLLINQGHESQIAYGRRSAKTCPEAFYFGNHLGFLFHVGLTFITDRHALYSSFSTRKLINFIEKYDPDLIHLHVIHGYYLNYKMLFNTLEKLNKPIIWTMHDCWAFTGHCAYFDFAQCSRWQAGCYDCPQKKSYPISLLLDQSTRNYRDKKALFNLPKNMMVVSPSHWLGDLVKQSFLSQYPVQVIHNGVDLDVFSPVSEAERTALRAKLSWEDKFVILAVANIWEPRKGYSTLENLIGLLAASEHLVMVGVNAYQQKRLPRQIQGITRTTSIQELADLYRAADVFINPTLDENFPTTNIEALACGTPVVTYQTGGSVESVDPTVGLIAQKNQPTDLLDKIRMIQQHGRQAYTQACRDKAVRLYGKEARYQDYIQLYHDRLGDPK